MTHRERRQLPRTPERLSIAVQDGGLSLTTETKNLSASGAYCLVDRFIPPMTKLALTFELPDGSRRVKIACAGAVVRVDPVITDAQHSSYHIAIFFTDLSDRDRAAIGRFVQHRLATATRTTH